MNIFKISSIFVGIFSMVLFLGINTIPVYAEDTYKPEIFFERTSYTLTETINLTIRDENENKDSDEEEFIFGLINTQKNSNFSQVNLQETIPDSGVFVASFKGALLTRDSSDKIFVLYEYLDDKNKRKQIQATTTIVPEKNIPKDDNTPKYITSPAIQNSYSNLASSVSIIPNQQQLPTGPWKEGQGESSFSSTCIYCISEDSQESLGKWEKRIDSKIRNLEGTSNPTGYASETILPYYSQQNQIQVLAKIENWENNLNLIRQLGSFEGQVGDFFQISVPVETLQDFAQTPGLKWAKAPTQPHLHANVLKSEGVEFIQADIPQIEGYSGKGVNVAVIDLAFDVTNSEITDRVNEQNIHLFRTNLGENLPIEGIRGSGDEIHGTAVAEIILDVAPEIDLHLYTIGTEVEFLNAIDYILTRDKEVDLIAMSLGWPNYTSDGTSPMTQKIEEVIQKGIPVVISAGNYAEMHWEGNFTDEVTINGMHEFEGSDEIQGIFVDDNLSPILIYLAWDNEADNFDLFLRHESSDEIVEESRNIQAINTGETFEYLSFQPSRSGMYEFGISCVLPSGCNPSTVLEVFSVTHTFEHSIPEGSVGVPVDAKGVISVGAIDFISSPFRPYSSQGPTNNQNNAPMLVGPDGVRTTAYEKYGNAPFFGTSAAGPHVAGVAALLLEKEPRLTPSQLLENLENFADQNAVPVQKPSDNMYGFGKVDASFIVTGEKPQTRIISGPTFEDQIESPIIEDESTPEKYLETDLDIPDWVKTNVGWWAEGKLNDQGFLSGLEFMVKEEIIKLPGRSKYLSINSNEFARPLTSGTTNDVAISGFVEEYRPGSSVYLKIKDSQGNVEEQKLKAAKGNFNTLYFIKNNSPLGEYEIISIYDDEEITKIFFSVQSKTNENQNPVVGPGAGVPEWVRNSGDWWSKGLISDIEFANGIEFLIKNKIINLQ